jgi:hypothetical protein
MDFFTVITANFWIPYCLFLILHDRREIVAERNCRKMGSKFSKRFAGPHSWAKVA